MAIYSASQSVLTGTGWYVFIMLFGNTIIPILLAVCLFAVLKKKINGAKWPVIYVAQAGLVLIIMTIGVCGMTISMSVSYYGWLTGWQPENIRSQFNGNYKGFIPDVLLDSFLIPAVYYWVSKVAYSKIASRDK